MCFNTKITCVIFLDKKNISFNHTNGDPQKIFEIKKELIDDLEIKNFDKFFEEFKNFLIENKINKTNTLLVLSEEILFSKEIIEEDPQKKKDEIDKFLSDIPIEPEKVVYKFSENKERFSVIGTNKELYLSVKTIYEKYGGKVKAVVPITAFWIVNINPETIKDVVENKSAIDSSNFLNDNLTTDDLKSKKTSSKKISVFIVLLLVFMLSAALSAFAYLKFNTNFNEENNKAKVLNTKPKITPTVFVPKKVEVEKKDTLNKETLKIEVLNGKGEMGVAKAASDLLIKKGYKNVETGNADSYDYEETIISLTPEKKNYFSELQKDLRDNYQISTEAGELKSDSDFDAVITIGKK